MGNLADHFLDGEIFSEHHAVYDPNYRVSNQALISFGDRKPEPIYFKGKRDACCFAITSELQIDNSYFIGIDWLFENEKAVYVQPKVNRNSNSQVDYLAMLFSALQHPEVFKHTSDLFEIKWNKPEIHINQQHDMLTPLLVLQYLQVVKSIVRKGLKKSYYKVEHNLRSRVKGKVLIAQNIKQNLAKSRTLNTYCAYDEFGFNGIENRLLKKALVFIERYLPNYQGIGNKEIFTHTFNYIRPAFEQVSAEASLHECRHIKANPFYKEYTLAIDLAKQILRRFGYNIQNTSTTQVTTPPFWIDMSKLFELYVLGLLKDSYKHLGTIDYQFGPSGNKLDYLLNVPGFQMVVDAKYKLKYDKGEVIHDDIRQVSGYARLKQVYARLNKEVKGEAYENKLIECMIIYPEGELTEVEKDYKLSLTKTYPVGDYVGVYQCGVKLPVIKYALTEI